ncbi:MAG: hypothetical protein HYT11_04220 [Candidatus Levybacteria bacterium]|nr:hypothetical protein [Candidatus Levybacteria bacterium]
MKISVLKLAIAALMLIITSSYLQFFGRQSGLEQIIEQTLLREIEKKISTPPPLLAKYDSPKAFLTLEGVVQITNIQREKEGLRPLVNNALLNSSALQKAQDMFAKQYFAHDSPDGIGVGDLAGSVGYAYIAIGENLALGNFANDEALVAGWMASPGHRANILDVRYQEIGVAVLQGTYQGKQTWIAVQHFGFPLSACPKPDSSLEQRIKDNQVRLEQMQRDLEAKKREIENTEPKHGPEYEQKVDEYNSMVVQYNALAEETRNLIETYNAQVQSFNQCAS